MDIYLNVNNILALLFIYFLFLFLISALSIYIALMLLFQFFKLLPPSGGFRRAKGLYPLFSTMNLGS